MLLISTLTRTALQRLHQNHRSKLISKATIAPSKLRNDRFLGALSVTVLSITKDIFVYLVITIRCKRRVKNWKFQFDSSDS
jgi:hypothetical protein